MILLSQPPKHWDYKFAMRGFQVLLLMITLTLESILIHIIRSILDNYLLDIPITTFHILPLGLWYQVLGMSQIIAEF